MVIFGKERGFLMSVGASAKIAKLCPGGKIERMNELFNGSYDKMVESLVEIAEIMSNYYEMHKKYFDEPTGNDPLTKEELMLLPITDMEELMNEIKIAMEKGMKKTIEAKPIKSKN